MIPAPGSKGWHDTGSELQAYVSPKNLSNECNVSRTKSEWTAEADSNTQETKHNSQRKIENDNDNNDSLLTSDSKQCALVI